MHDANVVQLGNVPSSNKVISSHRGVIAAGLAVCLKSDDTITTAKADGSKLGVSVGIDQSDAGYTSICRKGTRVPIVLTSSFSPVIGAVVHISDTTGKAGTAGSGFTASNATYVSEKLDSRSEDGATIVTDGVALIDMPGGL